MAQPVVWHPLFYYNDSLYSGFEIAYHPAGYNENTHNTYVNDYLMELLVKQLSNFFFFPVALNCIMFGWTNSWIHGKKKINVLSLCPPPFFFSSVLNSIAH